MKKAGIGAALVIGLALSTVPVTAASALGTRTAICDTSSNRVFTGVSNTARAYTQETAGTNGAGSCGSSMVRASYRTYSGSPLYWTTWKTGSDFAEAKPGNTMVGGDHKVTAPSSLAYGSFST